MIFIKPLIGIVVRNDDSNTKYFFLNREVCYSISKYGGIPIGICQNVKDIDEIINICDGFVLPGGDYFTDFDLKLIEKVKKINKPLLGICLGMQEMGYTFGGKIKEVYNHKSLSNYVHNVKIINNTKLRKIINSENILVNSRHHDSLIKTNLKISAVSDDGIIEAVEDENKKFFIGIQWHPESLIDTQSGLLFQKFIDICKE